MNEFVEKLSHRPTQSNTAEYFIILAQAGKLFPLPHTRFCGDRDYAF